MIRKFPILDKKGMKRIKYYLKNPPTVDDNQIKCFESKYDNTVVYLIRLSRYNGTDPYYTYKDLNSMIQLIYSMYGLSRITHYILYRFSQERKQYMQDSK
jgi:hypothetical protein